MKKRGQLFRMTLGVLLAVLAFSAGPAGAIYIGDGSKQNGTTDGSGNTTNWDITDYGVCVTGVQSDGTMVIDATKTSRPDCLTVVFPNDASLTSSALCVADTDANGGSHYWASTCVADDGTRISLKGLDRTATMCNQAAIKAGKTSGTMTSKCTGAWVFTGPAGDGVPGFCYTTMLMPQFTTSGTCPTGTTGYSWLTGTNSSVCYDNGKDETACDTAGLPFYWNDILSKCIDTSKTSTTCTGGTYVWTAWDRCTYSYGITGYPGVPVTRKDATVFSAVPNMTTQLDLSTLLQGQCLYAGASWSTGTTKSGTTTAATSPTYPADSTIATVTATRSGCLECHNNTSQYNTYAERWKTSYLNTGHKNMLRKVAPGKAWAGADEQAYTTDGTNTIDFLDASITVGGIKQNLYYVYGDWMAPLPSVVYGTNGFGSAPGATNGYSCAACHSTGWSNPDPTKGLCSLSTFTNSAACLGAGGLWTPSSGVQGASYVPPEPLASFPGITGITGAWDQDGIICSRCHSTVFSQTSPAPAGTGTHNVTAKNTASEANNNICFGCHQSPATDYTSNFTPGASPKGDKYLDPTMIPTGASHGGSWGREFNGHVLGNMFLNSPHARYTGTIVPNKLGKYDLAVNTTANYSSTFKGSICRSNTASGGGSVLATVIKGGAVTLIASQADCNLANGFGTEAAPDTTARGYWQAESVGNCTTCHDVHQSLFDATATEPLRRECGVTCHADKADWTAIKHPMGPGTPIGDGTSDTVPCEICHMPKPTAEGFPMHLWRINTNAAYDTFPTKTAFYGGSCSDPTKTNPAACTGAGGTWTSATMDRRAKTTADGTYTQAVWVDLDLACGQCHGGSAGASAVTNGAPYMDKTYLAFFAAGMHSASAALLPPTAANTSLVTNTGLAVSFKDNSTDNNGQAQGTLSISVNWGDGKVSSGVGGGTFTHTYTSAGTYTIVHTAKDTGARIASELIPIKISTTTAVNYTLMVKVRGYAAAPPLPGIVGATLYLQKLNANGNYVQANYNFTNASGNYTFNRLVIGGTYKVIVNSPTTDFNGALAYKQAQIATLPFVFTANSIVEFDQGAPATNGVAPRPAWAGTNGGAPTIIQPTPLP